MSGNDLMHQPATDGLGRCTGVNECGFLMHNLAMVIPEGALLWRRRERAKVGELDLVRNQFSSWRLRVSRRSNRKLPMKVGC